MDWNLAFLINLLITYQRACAGWQQGLPPATPLLPVST